MSIGDAYVQSVEQDREEWTKEARVGYISLEDHFSDLEDLRKENEKEKSQLRSERDEEHRLRMAAEVRIKELEEAALKSEDAHKEELAKYNEVQEMADKAKANEIDMMSIVKVIQNRLFNHNSDRMRFLNSQLDIDDETVREQSFEAIIQAISEDADKELNGNAQSTLSKYIHQIMDYLRVRLEALMLEVMRSCSFVQNDETRILVRSRKSKEDNFKYNTEYIHAALSLEKKLVVIRFSSHCYG